MRGADQRRGRPARLVAGERVPALRAVLEQTTSETCTGSGPSSQPSTAIAVSRSPPPLARRSSTTARDAAQRLEGLLEERRRQLEREQRRDAQHAGLADALGRDAGAHGGGLRRVGVGPAARLRVRHEPALGHPLDVEVAAEAPRLRLHLRAHGAVDLAPVARRSARGARRSARRAARPPASAARASRRAPRTAGLARTRGDASRRSAGVHHRVDRERAAGARDRHAVVAVAQHVVVADRDHGDRRQRSCRAPPPARPAASGCGRSRPAGSPGRTARSGWARACRGSSPAGSRGCRRGGPPGACSRTARRTRAAARSPRAGGGSAAAARRAAGRGSRGRTPARRR